MRPTNFTDWYQYGSYVKDTICRGMRVRYCGINSVNGKVEFGDTGKVLRLHRHSLDSLNVEVFIFLSLSLVLKVIFILTVFKGSLAEECLSVLRLGSLQ